MAERLNATARDVEADLAWLAALLQHRLDTYFAEKPACPALPGERPAPMLADSPSPYAEFLRRHALTDEERAVLLLAERVHKRLASDDRGTDVCRRLIEREAA